MCKGVLPGFCQPFTSPPDTAQLYQELTLVDEDSNVDRFHSSVYVHVLVARVRACKHTYQRLLHSSEIPLWPHIGHQRALNLNQEQETQTEWWLLAFP